MTRFGSQYQVSRPTGQCAHTGRALEPGTPCITALCEREVDEGFDRLDFSIEAWEEGIRPPGLFSYWKTVVPDPNTKPKMLVDDAVLLELFDRLAEDDRPQRVAFRFVLGLILMRKKQIRLVGRKPAAGEGEPERWLIQHKGADPEAPPRELINPHLTEDDVRSLTDQLSEVLNSELE